MNNIVDVFIAIGKTQLYTLGIISASYIVEKITGLRLFIDHYIWKKSLHNAEVLSIGNSAFYFFLNLFVFGYDIYKGRIEPNIVKILLWCIITYFLVKIFHHFHRKYQGVDPNKADDYYT